MTSCYLTRTPSGALAPADAETAAFVGALKVGQGLRADVVRVRSVPFHRKAFALFNYAFDLWDAPAAEFKGEPIAKCFDRFRKDITILAGYYETSVRLNGEIRIEAKSLAFDKMEADEFAECYKAILGVIWDKVLRAKGYASPAEVDRIVAELLRFE